MIVFAFRRARLVSAALLAGLVAALIAGLVSPRSAHAQSAVPTLTYVYLRNTDTIGVETITHTPTSVDGVLAMKGSPRIAWSQAHQNANPGILTMQVYTPGSAADAAPVQQLIIEMRGDSAVIVFVGPTPRTQVFPSKAGAVPLINASVLHAALLASYARRTNASTLNLFLTAGAQTMPATLSILGDTTRFQLATSETRILSAPDGMPSAILIPSKNIRVVRVTGNAKAPSTAAMRINYDAPAGAPYTAEHVRIATGRGYELAATLTTPNGVSNGVKKSPVLITISGSGPQERDSRISIVEGYAIFRQIADTLGRRGIAVLRFDDRGVGESTGRESAATATSADFADDVRSIVTWLRARADIDGARIALAGHSEGGMIAPMVASTDKTIKGIALLAGPAYTGKRVSMYQNRQVLDGQPSLSPKQRDSILATVPAKLDSAGKATPWLGYWLTHDPVVVARTVTQPVLILQGLTDTQVSPEQADTLAIAFRRSGNRHVTVRTFAATNHLFVPDASGQFSGYTSLKDPKVRPAVLGALADWAVQLLSAPASEPASSPNAPVSFVYLLNSGDTIGVETVTRGATGINGVLSLKGQPRVEWDQAQLTSAPGMLTMRVFAPDADAKAAPVQSGTVQMRGDSAYIDFIGGTQHVAQAMATKAGAYALVNTSVLHAALLAARAKILKLKTFDLFLTSGAQTLPGLITYAGDTTVFTLGNSEMRILLSADGLPSSIALPGQGARVMRASGTVAFSAHTAAPRVHSYDAPSGAPYTAEHVKIPSGRGYELAATLTKPKGVSKPGVVITISGSGPQERDSEIGAVPGFAIFREIADTLGHRGIAVLRFDDRGVGESGGAQPSGKVTSADYADDVRSVIAYLRTRSDIDGTRIALAGHSEGGMIAPMVASSDPSVKAIALFAGTAYNGRKILLFQNRQAIDAEPNLTKTQRDSTYARVVAQLDSVGNATPWIGYFLRYEPLTTARRVKQPVLILQGLTDRQVTPEQADSLAVAFRAGGNTAVTVRKFPATNHLFLADSSGAPNRYAELQDTRVRRDVLGALADWASRILK